MNTSLTNRLLLKDEILVFENTVGTQIPLPHLTRFLELYRENLHTPLEQRIKDMLSRDLGSLLIVETMIDPNHEVTLKRLETGEISKNMKHVNDYYVIFDSEYDRAKTLFEQYVSNGILQGAFEDCHFSQFPFGLVIKRAAFPQYYNEQEDISILQTLLENK